MKLLGRILTALVGAVVALLALVGIRRSRPQIARPSPAEEVLAKAKPRIDQVRLQAKAEVKQADEGKHGTLAEEQARADKAMDRWRR